MKCQVSHYVSHLDEEQTVTQYDYFWCDTHHRKCGSDGCEAVEHTLAVDGARWWVCECGMDNEPEFEACIMCGTRPATKA
jgi:hypothetical protein